MSQEINQAKAAVYEDPDNQDAWAVYADYLLDQRDPRGEFTALCLALEHDPENAELKTKVDRIFQANRKFLIEGILEAGKPVPRFAAPGFRLEWKNGFIRKARLFTNASYHGRGGPRLLKAIMESESSRFLYDLTLPEPGGIIGRKWSFPDVLKQLLKTETHPGLRRLNIGEIHKDAFWEGSRLGKLEGLLEIFPNLEVLFLSGRYLSLNNMRHANLKSFHLKSLTRLNNTTLEALSWAICPELESLGFDLNHRTDLSEFHYVFQANRFPKLRHLTLINTALQSSRKLRLFLESDLFKQLGTLELSSPTLGKSEAKIFLEYADRMSGLDYLIIHKHKLKKELKALRERFRGRLELRV